MPSFDIVSEVNKQEVKNAIEQTNKEVSTRFDFKGSDARVEQKEMELTVFADNEFQLNQVIDVMRGKLAKRSVDVRFLELKDPEKIGGDKMKRAITVKNGVPVEKSKAIAKLIKEAKIKVTTSIQGDALRVQGAQEGRPAGGHPAGARQGRGPPAAVHQFQGLGFKDPLQHWVSGQFMYRYRYIQPFARPIDPPVVESVGNVVEVRDPQVDVGFHFFRLLHRRAHA